MVSLKALGIRHDQRPTAKLYRLDDALRLAGITRPTYYRWLRAGKIKDRRIRGNRGATQLPADAVLELRDVATRVAVIRQNAN